jgi:hypothetical protein
MIGSQEARAYLAWTRASGAVVAAVTAPRSLSAGVLTVGCQSSIWANELTYLGAQILQRMNELCPGHAVKRLRFVVAPTPGSEGPEVDADATPDAANRLPRSELDGARAAAAGIRDERLSGAVEAALRAAAGEP